MVLSVQQIAGSADTAAQGEALYVTLANALKSNGAVTVSFAELQTATSSFVNLAFVPLLTTFSLDEIKHRIKIVQSTRQINEMIKARLEREAEAHTPH
jgi:hypothetical protein